MLSDITAKSVPGVEVPLPVTTIANCWVEPPKWLIFTVHCPFIVPTPEGMWILSTLFTVSAEPPETDAPETKLLPWYITVPSGDINCKLRLLTIRDCD